MYESQRRDSDGNPGCHHAQKNGREVYEILRERYPDMKFLFLSGYTADIIDRFGIEESSVSFLAKPVSPQQLQHKVREVLDSRQPLSRTGK